MINDIPAVVWAGIMSLITAFVAHVLTKRKYNVEIDDRTMDVIIKKDKYNKDRYDEILEELKESHAQIEILLSENMTMRQQLRAQQEKITDLIARLNVLKITKN